MVASDDCAVEDSVYCVSCILETVIAFFKIGGDLDSTGCNEA